jgi:hypothetical protein
MNGECEEASNINARRLVKIEKNAQEGISQLRVEIQKGSLFQAFIEDNNKKFVIISKADHSDFLDETDFTRHAGLPLKKRLFKAALVEVDDDGMINNVYVYDTSSAMSVYWWRDYLELSELFTDNYNTMKSLDILERKVFNKIKSEYPADHTYLRNSTLGYFRTRNEFFLDEYIQDVFGDYVPANPDFPTNYYVEVVRGLPDKFGFDHKFGIDKNEIKKRRVAENRISLAANVELVLTGQVDNIRETIKSSKEPDGRKYLKIYSDRGYEAFVNSET